MSIESPEEKAKHRIRQLIWLYLWLLLIEGALRKWVMPRFSNPLLLIRDPVMPVTLLPRPATKWYGAIAPARCPAQRLAHWPSTDVAADAEMSKHSWNR